ncbi:antibiotic biosynthesis monooxygenase [Roseovarius sp. EL26]|uniref:antibiotic biosynthesis monooxygenase family protein n=1 Tax=Roseovarius sp. EL26 TaxID=2126672 RepID=UPI000EA3F893|nr:antibiotic biosynthesis monooxygenase [Roseovarius sp. EL26]
MIVMVFEFDVEAHEMDDYMQTSTNLREHLNGIEGFISIERFENPTKPGRFVAIGYFEDEDAVTKWRNLPVHRRAQALGRSRFFNSYRLVMADVTRDYTHDLRRESAPDDSIKAHRG